MYNLIDGKLLAKKVREELKKKVEAEKLKLKLAVILVGNDPASEVYVRNKSKACKEVGIDFEEFLLPEQTTMDELLCLIDKLNIDTNISGILLQAPLPKGLNINQAFARICPEKDVDGFNPMNIGKLSIKEDAYIPCTPLGIMKMFEEYKIDVEGKDVVVIGRSNIVGKPMAQCLLNKNATITICHSRTKNLPEYTKKADIIISAVGKVNIVTADMVKAGAVVIDVGMNRNEDGKLVGDVAFDDVKDKCSFITPVPGGVGPMTVAMLMNNVVKTAVLNRDKKEG